MPFIGKMDIGSMTPFQAKELLYDLRDISNPLNAGRPVSGTYANKIYATMKQVWDFALQNDYVDSNIFKSNEVKAPPTRHGGTYPSNCRGSRACDVTRTGGWHVLLQDGAVPAHGHRHAP